MFINRRSIYPYCCYIRTVSKRHISSCNYLFLITYNWDVTHALKVRILDGWLGRWCIMGGIGMYIILSIFWEAKTKISKNSRKKVFFFLLNVSIIIFSPKNQLKINLCK